MSVVGVAGTRVARSVGAAVAASVAGCCLLALAALATASVAPRARPAFGHLFGNKTSKDYFNPYKKLQDPI